MEKQVLEYVEYIKTRNVPINSSFYNYFYNLPMFLFI